MSISAEIAERKAHIRNLLAVAKFDEAFTLLLDLTDNLGEECRDYCIVISMRYNDFMKESSHNNFSYEDRRRYKSEIAKNILDLLRKEFCKYHNMV